MFSRAMDQKGSKRRLSAILMADVVGYSRLMGRDEQATVHTLTAYREIFRKKSADHDGRVVNAPGDSILAEFNSVVNCVACAVKVQQEVAEKNAELPDDRRMAFRIGINLGDVLVEDGALYGDGVNIAARLESMADAGGIILSSSAYDQVKKKLPLQYEYLGEQQVKNIDEPLRVYRVRLHSPGGDVSAPPPAGQATPRGKASKTALVVLPFDNMGGDPEQTYFSDGLTEDLITDLSKLSGLSVIARNTAFTFKGQAVNVQQVGRELGVDYILEGSVRRAGGRLRLTAQLIDVESGLHVWAERYDRQMDDIFDVQDEITRNIVTALHVQLLEGEQARVWRKSTQSPEAYDRYLKGVALARRTGDSQTNQQAIRLFKQAIDADANFAQAYAALGWRYLDEWVNGWSDDPDSALEKTREVATKAISLDDTTADAFSVLGNYYLFKSDYTRALTEMERSVGLNPENADATARLGRVQCYAGKLELSVETIRRAMSLTPIYPFWYNVALGQAYYYLGKYDEAIAEFKESNAKFADSLIAHITLAGIYAAGERVAEAEAEVREVLRIEPNFNLEEWADRMKPMLKAGDSERFMNTLRKAGLE